MNEEQQQAYDYAQVMLGFAARQGVEVKNFEGEWMRTENPRWDWTKAAYRLVPKLAECWVWQYPTGRLGATFDSKEDADRILGEINSNGRAILMRQV